MGLGSQIGGAIGGYEGARKEKRFQQSAMEEQLKAIKKMRAYQKAGAEESEAFYEKSLGELNAVGPAMRTELLAREQQGLSAQKASALGTGLTGTTAMSGQLRGMRADTGRNLASLEESLAGARSSLYSRRGAEVYGQYIDRANIRQRTKFDPFLANWRPGAMTAAGAAGGAAWGGIVDEAAGEDAFKSFLGGMGQGMGMMGGFI